MTIPRRNRIVDHRIVKGRDLLPNPASWREREARRSMSFVNCANCGHVYTKEGDDIPYGEIMGIIHGGGVCRSCYLEAGHKECECGTLAVDDWKFCRECGKAF